MTLEELVVVVAEQKLPQFTIVNFRYQRTSGNGW